MLDLRYHMPYIQSMNDKAELSLVIYELEKRGVTRRWMAGRIGITPGHFYRYLNGKSGLGLAAKKLLFRELNLSEEVVKAS